MIPVSEELAPLGRAGREGSCPSSPGVCRYVDPNEIYRRKLLFMAERLRHTLDQTRTPPPPIPAWPSSWRTCASFATACWTTAASGSPTGGSPGSHPPGRGLRLPSGEARRPSGELHGSEAVAELVSAEHRRRPPGHGRGGARRAAVQAPRRPCLSLTRAGRRSRKNRRKSSIPSSASGRRRKRYSGAPVETFVLSMARHASDVLCVQLLARTGGAARGRRGRPVHGQPPQGHAPLRDRRRPRAGSRGTADACWRTRSTARRSARARTCRRSCSATATPARTPAT